ncbi:LPS assembly protein LptD [Candidatus Curculioniphilus buchneri]|uniref:LPS assembly protein LptD n=1 Tax=Candidatus Curculioniphilus buchneri TaxID=690594 RepID=UPI00376EB690
MKKCFSTPLTSLIWYTLFSQHTLANVTNQRLTDSSTYSDPLINNDLNALPMYIQADKIQITYPEKSIFSGNVNIQHGNSILKSDQVLLHQQQDANGKILGTINAIGNISYFSNEIFFQGSKAWLNLNNKDFDIYQGHYQLIGRQGRGSAKIIEQRDNKRYIILKKGTFTSCLPNDKGWSLVGSKIIHDRQDQSIKLWNARFKIGKISVFYIPYLKIPIGETRRSGFLSPSMKYRSENGFEFSTPYYFNLSPHYNSMIIPTYMIKHGIKLANTLHYVIMPSKGLVKFNWLPNKKIYRRYHSDDHNHWLFHWKHDGIVNKVWRINVNYTKLSQFSDFNDLNVKYTNIDEYIIQKLIFGYSNKHWDTVLSCKQFQTLNASKINSYHSVQQLDVIYYKNYLGPFDIKVLNQITKFNSLNNNVPLSVQLYIEPEIRLPLANHWGHLNTEAKVIAAHYCHHKHIDNYHNTTKKHHHIMQPINYILPMLKTDGQIIFERNIDTGYLQGYRQTLEPWGQSMYVFFQNRNISNPYNFVNLQTDYYKSLYNRFYSTKLSHIIPFSTLSSGVTTRIYDNQNIEKFKISIGLDHDIFKTGNCHIIKSWNQYNNINNMMLWTEKSYLHINNRCGIRSNLQYNVRNRNMLIGYAMLEYRKDESHIIQFNYRYASSQYIHQILSEAMHNGYRQGIDQFGITSIWPLSNHWSLANVCYYDNKAKQLVEQLINLQYRTCCWSINFGYERQLAKWKYTGNSYKYKNRASFKIELRGLTKIPDLTSDSILNTDILPYQCALQF